MMMVNTRLNAFGEFVREHRPRLERLATRLCSGSGINAEDVVGETLERALLAFESLEGREDRAVNTWLITTLSQCFLDRSRGQRQRQSVDPGPARQAPRAQDEVLATHLTPEVLQKTVDLLQTRFREVYTQPMPRTPPGTFGGTGWLM
jgi:DNA-directed RNA polymerase specialized sigma24 family protein